jgi:excisionase family DNA binding protein
VESRTSPRPASPSRTWLTMHEASDLIGVSQATLRRWAEAGDVEAFVTPGGHRRFTQGAILGLLPRPGRPHRSLRELGETPERIVRQYRRELAGANAPTWVPALAESERESFREPGRRILGSVIAYLDAETPADGEIELARARVAAAEYGRLAAGRALGVQASTAAFLRFRAPFLEELATTVRRRRVETSDAISLIIAAASVFDRLLLALLEGHDDASRQAAGAPSAATQSARSGS